jgi:hypothetical protein
LTVIKVEKIDGTTYKVTIDDRSTTTHTVTVDPAYYKKLTRGEATPEHLIAKSFEFLLERESNTSILSSFDLPVIGRYFPEYERTIRGMLE